MHSSLLQREGALKVEVPKGLLDWSKEEREHLGEELLDVLLYLVRLSDICGVDLGKASLRKVELNSLKYPVEQCRSSSNKYNQYRNNLKVLDEFVRITTANGNGNHNAEVSQYPS